MHFFDAVMAGQRLGISSSAFRKRAERAGILPVMFPKGRLKYTGEQVERVRVAKVQIRRKGE
jgi:hypothetical protein